MARALVILVAAGTLVLAPPTSAKGQKNLYGWASSYHHPPVGMSSVGWDGRALKRIAPGTYRLNVTATDLMPFHLVGPGVNRKTTTGPSARGATVYVAWTVRLRTGRYRYSAEGGDAASLRANGFKTTGSFVVR